MTDQTSTAQSGPSDLELRAEEAMRGISEMIRLRSTRSPAISQMKEWQETINVLLAAALKDPPADVIPSDLDRLIRVGDLPAPITNPEAWPTGYADGFNDYARMVAQTAPPIAQQVGVEVTDRVAQLRNAIESEPAECFGTSQQGCRAYSVRENLLHILGMVEAALASKADGECRYCGDTGYFYSEPEFGSCSCPLGKVTQPSEDRQDMKDRLLAALESSAAYQSALAAIGDLAASCADGNALAEALATIESISNHAIGRKATQPAATGAGEGESLESQVDRLANFIIQNIPGEPSQSQGAIDTAIRLLNPVAAMSDALSGQEAMLAWAVNQWHDQVANRPLVNVHRRSLDDVWRQVIRHCGADDVVLIGPRHDQLLAESQESKS